MPEINRTVKKDVYSVQDVVEALQKLLDGNPNVSWMGQPQRRADPESLDESTALIVDGLNNDSVLLSDAGEVEVQYPATPGEVVVDNFHKFTPDPDSGTLRIETPVKDRLFPASHVDAVATAFQRAFPMPTREDEVIRYTVNSVLQDNGKLPQIIDALHDEGVDASLYEEDIKEAIAAWRKNNRRVNRELLKAARGTV
jgi:hypothetical protein